jgi:1-deoxy-D-xylulose-5-phosphate synthase
MLDLWGLKMKELSKRLSSKQSCKLTCKKVLDTIDSPSDLSNLDNESLNRLATELRDEIVKVVSLNGGHLASSLGSVEITIALHRVFGNLQDKIVWDVGHQAYAHKLLTGRKGRFSTIRQLGGLSGFPSRSESRYDAFGTGHAGTSISAALGMAVVRDLNKQTYNVVAVIGDGSIGAGMSFEAINHAGQIGKKIIIVLNDNGMSISPSVGAIAKILNQVRTDARYESAKKTARKAIIHIPFGDKAWILSKRLKSGMESVIVPNAFWNQLGFTYLGPINGHNIKEMEAAFTRARDSEIGPTIVHVLTDKGKGHPAAENDAVKYHGISPLGVPKPRNVSYSQIFGQSVSQLMRENQKIVAISAAMIEGTGLSQTALEFPGRVFDVGICEQHAVTFAAGLASSGMIPIVAIYSTFLQRAYDQIIHDVCIQNLPVIFAIDRAGIVGEDGVTHQGPFDISFLRCLPNMAIGSPCNENELGQLLYSAIGYNQPFALRYPRGSGLGIELDPTWHEIAVGKGEIVKQGNDITLLAIGPIVNSAIDAATMLAKEGLDCAVVNARFAKPLDSELILNQAARTGNLLTIEENALCCGFGSSVLELLSLHPECNVKVKTCGLPDHFIEHGPVDQLRSMLRLDAEGIASSVVTLFPELCTQISLNKLEEKL